MVKKTAVEFINFIKKYGVIGLSLGVVIGGAVKTLTDSLVNNIINPLLGKFVGESTFTDFEIWDIRVGAFVNDTIKFVILMLVVFLSMKFFIDRFLSEEEKSKLK